MVWVNEYNRSGTQRSAEEMSLRVPMPESLECPEISISKDRNEKRHILRNPWLRSYEKLMMHLYLLVPGSCKIPLMVYCSSPAIRVLLRVYIYTQCIYKYTIKQSERRNGL